MRALLTAVAMMMAGQVAAEPGRLLVKVPLAGAPVGAEAWPIRYETHDRDGRRTESTGMVIAPKGAAPAGGRPVVAWTHGTVGVAEACSPSKLYGPKSIPGLADMIARGWVVVATDYPGLGTPGPHAYLVGSAAARAALDSVRAAGRIPAAGAGTRFAVWGHSQGGHAALWTGQRARAEAPELTLVGVAAASPPTDLVANFGAADPKARAVLSAFVATSWERVYGLKLGDLGNRTTAGVIRSFGKACQGEGRFGTKVDALRLMVRLGDVNIVDRPAWRVVAAGNSLGREPIGVPLLVTQGAADDLVRAGVTERFVGESCKRGEVVRYVSVAGGDHAGNAVATAATAVAWMADRFSGAAEAGTCRAPR
ncbi:lipase family protein [Sandaracinobacteroides saxicola]|uniref:Alpha/beta fold hydrolase n=1 Tax=Sandaracinobacteroides saxicola TaxID=2759707 RepID=A0A7G5IKI4_9SPHN|nr:lipase family protein [Sandaracinobacteroides saxicola]QMW23876.1 alpha/beta fold hydrolase [Sandaracinobacteroides saxicola]